MDQLTQKLKSAEMKVVEVAMPVVSEGMVLVRNHYSLISAGTEGSTVKTARKSLLMKAKERPQQVKQVLDVLKKQGITQTYRAVMKKLEAYSPLGYSSAGEVVATGPGVRNFFVGDRVACGGAGYANHAEYICVPVNLCVRLSEKSDLKSAAYNTLGAIALQGVRQADLRIGETCAVIGLGLIGQLTCQILNASGMRTIGIDIDPWSVELASRIGTELSLIRTTEGISERIMHFTDGLGVDSVIITAGSSSLDPVNFAGEIARKKGKVIIVGAVPTGFDRDPYYYRKELDLRMSCSYGPGRYDFDYEELGIDYPPEYVRWTENRNMSAFQQLILSGKINVAALTTHEFPLEKAPSAYEIILQRSEPFMGILIQYDVQKHDAKQSIVVTNPAPMQPISIAFIGAGSYAQSHLLPNLPVGQTGTVKKGIMTMSGTTSRRVAEKFGFEFCTSDQSQIFNNPDINTVFIATRHDTHARYVIEALKSNKNVFVEKPLCLHVEELTQIRKLMLPADGLGAFQNRHLMVGFNRRFSSLAEQLKSKLSPDPSSMLFRINAGQIPPDHWIQKKDIGGGRIVGEVCHFIDFMSFISGSVPCKVSAMAVPDPECLHDTVTISLTFKNGSIGTIAYYSTGARTLSKEHFEVYQSGMTGIIHDFKSMEMHYKSKPYVKKLVSQNKGQAEMTARFIDSIRQGSGPLITFDDIYNTTMATFGALESINSGNIITWE